MGWIMLLLVLLVFAVFFKLTFKLLPLAALYLILIFTVLSDWYNANTQRGDMVGFVLIGINVVWWIVQIARRIVCKLRRRKSGNLSVEELVLEQAAAALRNGKQNVRINSDGPVPFVEYD